MKSRCKLVESIVSFIKFPGYFFFHKEIMICGWKVFNLSKYNSALRIISNDKVEIILVCLFFFFLDNYSTPHSDLINNFSFSQSYITYHWPYCLKPLCGEGVYRPQQVDGHLYPVTGLIARLSGIVGFKMTSKIIFFYSFLIQGSFIYEK